MTGRNGTAARGGWSGFLVLSLVALCASACRGPESALHADGQSRQAQGRPGTEPQSTSGARTITIEMDAPAEFSRTDARGEFFITAFQVGFFNGERLVRAVEIPRAATRANAGKVALDIPLIPVNGGGSLSVRLRPLSSGALGPWSASAGSVELPALARPPRQERSAGARAGGADRGSGERPRRPLTLAEVQRHAALIDALESQLDGDLSLEEAVASFARVQDVAVAVLLSRKHDFPLPRLCAILRTLPSRSLRRAVGEVKPSIDADAEIKAASAEARRLVGARRGRAG